jgi:hypothetical protein
MSRGLRRLGLLVVALLLAPPAFAADQVLSTVTFHPIDDEPFLQFLTRFFNGHFPNAPNWSFGSRFSHRENWTTELRSHGHIAAVDLGDNGVHELVVTVDDPDWCEADGCLAAIFRPSAQRDERLRPYEYVCQAPLVVDGTTVLAQKENDYHLMATKANFIHWSAQQEFDSGQLCWTENRS